MVLLRKYTKLIYPRVIGMIGAWMKLSEAIYDLWYQARGNVFYEARDRSCLCHHNFPNLQRL